MSKLSRRALVAAAGALPALGLPLASQAIAAPAIAAPPIAASVPEPAPTSELAAATDPVLAAIDEMRRLYREWHSLCDQFDDSEADARTKEKPPYGFRMIHSDGRDEIKRLRKQLINEGVPSEKIDAECKELRAALRAQRAWEKRHGLATLKAEFQHVDKARAAAEKALTKARPTTPAGAGALISYILHDRESGEADWHWLAFANAARALLGMPNDAIPSEALEPDIDLINAAHALSGVDIALDRLHREHGDAANDRSDYTSMDAKRDVALRVLRSTRARTSNGIVAKARALAAKPLTEDFHRHGQISTSLARDVLRYFGAAAGAV